jgi:hypothetical protein
LAILCVFPSAFKYLGNAIKFTRKRQSYFAYSSLEEQENKVTLKILNY